MIYCVVCRLLIVALVLMIAQQKSERCQQMRAEGKGSEKRGTESLAIKLAAKHADGGPFILLYVAPTVKTQTHHKSIAIVSSQPR